MKHIELILSVVTFAVIVCVGDALAQQPSNGVVNGGLMKLVNGEPATNLVRETTKVSNVAVPMGGSNAIIGVAVEANRYQYIGPFGARTNDSLELVEFRIISNSGTPFKWFCYDISESYYPRDFTLFTATNNVTYAVFQSRTGVLLSRVDSSVSSDDALALYVQEETGPSPLTRLSYAIIRGAGIRYFGANALHWTMSVDNVAVVNGDLRVTLHGQEAIPQFTFVLRNGEWYLLRD